MDPVGGFKNFTDDWKTMDDGGVGGDYRNNVEQADNYEINLDMEELLRHMEPAAQRGLKILMC